MKVSIIHQQEVACGLSIGIRSGTNINDLDLGGVVGPVGG